MIKNLLKYSAVIFAICFSFTTFGQTSGTLTFSFTEVPKTPTYNGNSQHVLAVWIQTSTGAFVKTKLRYVGGGTSDHLPTWASNASCTSGVATSIGCNTLDATTGATRSTWTSYAINWDGSKGAAGTGTLQPDGVYKVVVQSTWNHGGTGTAIATYTFTKGPLADHQTLGANTFLTGVQLDWLPGVSIGINEAAIQSPGVEIYPNPTSGVFNVSFSNATSIKVMNTLGTVVYEEKVDQDLSEATKRIDMSHFANGIYLINVSNGMGSTNHKIILNK